MDDADSPAGRRAGWRGALRESATIAAGALAALAGQAWFQDQQDRGRERDYLRQLVVDTRENEHRLDAAIEDDSTVGRDIYRVVRAFARPEPLPPADSLRRWVLHATASSDFKPVVGTYNALVSSGDLRLVRTDSLRTMLVAYAAALDDERQFLRLILQLGIANIDVLPRRLPFTRALFLDSADRPPAAAFDFAAIRDDPEVAALLFRLQASNQNRVSHLRRLRTETRRVLRALEADAPGGVAAAPEAPATR